MTEPIDGDSPDELLPRWEAEQPPREGPWTRGGTIVGALAALAAVATFGFTVLQSQHDEPSGGGEAALSTGLSRSAVPETLAEPAQESGAPTPAATPTTATEPTADEAQFAVGDCLDSQTDVVDCMHPHASQVFSLSSDCELSPLSDFLGTSEADSIRPDISHQKLGDSTACVVALESDEPITGSLEGSFAEARSAIASQLRHCLDRDLAPTGCDVKHHGEVVGFAPDSQSCPGVAASYLGWEGSGLPSGLALAARGSQPQECLITIKGDNTLTDTLRDIGRRSLPIAALD